MSLEIVFSPFSQKYLLHKRHLQGRPDGALRLLIDANLNWHWGVRDDPFYAEVKRNFKKLVNEDFSSYSTGSTDEGHIIDKQPVWDMDKCTDEDKTDEDKDESNKPLPEEKRPGQGGEWRMEHWAYYMPAHTSDPNLYGIHLTKRGVAKLAYEIHQLCPGEPLKIVQLAAIYKLFAHEMCHAWIEDICCLIDFSEGESAPNLARRYAKTNQRYNSYIFMEEAICNTAAYGWLQNFLCGPADGLYPSMPCFNPQKILGAFEQWMKGQPRGYRDFRAIKQPPHQSELFIRNVCRLLAGIYKVDEILPRYSKDRNEPNWKDSRPWNGQTQPKASMATGVFFGEYVTDRYVTPDGRHFRSRNTARFDALWAGEPPLHIEF